MATRTRSRARQQIPEEQQSKITDVFSATRKGKTVTKSTKDAVIEDVKPIVKSTVRTTKRVKKEIEKTIIPSENPVEVSVPSILESPPRRPRKTPTPPNSPPKEEQPSTAVRRLFSEDVTPVVTQQKELSNTAAELPFGLKDKKPEQKRKGVLDLRARLAQAQKTISQAKEMGKNTDLLKSPTKTVTSSAVPLASPIKKLAPIFISPSKKPLAIKIGQTEKLSIHNIPDFVLPTFKSPVKQVDDEFEMEQRNIFERGQSARLFTEVKENNLIRLPTKYANLLERFHNLDRIVSIFVGRGSRCEVNDVFKNVQRNIKKEINRNHLAQIITVYPQSYNLRLDEQRNISGQPIGRYDLILAPNLIDDLTSFMRPESPKKALLEEPLPKVLPGPCLSPMKSPRKKAIIIPREAELDLRPKLEGWRIMNRKYVMHHLLAVLVKKYYAKFLERMGVTPADTKRFHPTFLSNINSECEDIEYADLPEPERKEPIFKDVRALLNTVKAPETEKNIELENKSVSRNIALDSNKLAMMCATKPGTMSLIERIKAKEAKNKMIQEARDPEAERKFNCLDLLHTKLLRSLLNFYTSQKGKCRSICLHSVVEKLKYSTNTTEKEIKDCLDILCATAGKYVAIASIQSSKYLQIEPDAHDRLREAVKKEFEIAKPSTPSFLKGR